MTDTPPARVTDSDLRFMREALDLGRAGLGRTWPNPSVGCVLVSRSGEVIGRGATAPGGRPHAETQALAEAGERAQGATAYVTLEPCSHFGKTPPCSDALVAAGIARVVCALGDPDPRVHGRGFARLREAGITVVGEVLADIAARDHAGHVARVVHGRPFVQLKMALSRDGMVGLPGRRVAITAEPATQRVHELRSRVDAILVGIGTVLADDPLLTVRLPASEGRSPVRVVVDSDLRLPVGSRLVQTAQDVPVHVWCGYGAGTQRASVLEGHGVVVHRAPTPWLGARGVELRIVLRDLVKLGLTRVMVEGGPTIAAALLERDLVDEVVLFEAPGDIGRGGLPAFTASARAGLDAPDRFELLSREQIGDDVMTRRWRRR